MNCILCGNNHWRALPIPKEGRSITTAGIVIEEPLQREQCTLCGLLRKSFARFIGNGRFYEEQYENYYNRPGAGHYDKARYDAMADWMQSALGALEARSILDIGCGAGWSMAATSARFTKATIEGVEPSFGNAERARKAGFVVHSTRLGYGQMLSKKYDLVYAHNVLQHVVDPIGFLANISSHLTPGARVVFILPDADEPSNEMMWCDHNFSFRAADIALLADRTGFHVTVWQPNPANSALLNKQLVILARTDYETKLALPSSAYSPDELFERRAEYFLRWRALDEELKKRVGEYKRIYNFGGSMWTWLLAGYCPIYWTRVEACLVDGAYGRVIDKTVLSPSEISLSNDDCIVLGINPANQAFAKRRFSPDVHIVSWSDQIAI